MLNWNEVIPDRGQTRLQAALAMVADDKSQQDVADYLTAQSGQFVSLNCVRNAIYKYHKAHPAAALTPELQDVVTREVEAELKRRDAVRAAEAVKEPEVSPQEQRRTKLVDLAVRKQSKRQTTEQAALELMAETVQMAIQEMKPLVVPTFAPMPLDTDCDDEVAVLHISDSQVGEVVDTIHCSGLGEYNSNLFIHRARYLTRKVLRIVDLHRHATNVKELVILFGGDYIHNDTMRGSSKAYADLDTAREVVLAARVFIEMILALLPHFERVRVVLVEGNHGRIGKPGDNNAMSNLDYIMSALMRDTLYCLVPDRERLSIEVPYSLNAIVDVMGYKFLLTHGEQIKSWLGIPFYAAERAKANLSKLYDIIGERFDYLMVGHHHVYANFENAIGEVWMNGSWVGPSSFSVDVLQRGSLASQNMFFVHARQRITARYRLNLSGVRGPGYSDVDLLSDYLDPEFISTLRAG